MRLFALSLPLALILPAGCFLPGEPAKPPVVTGAATGALAPGARVGARLDGVLELAEITKLDGARYELTWARGRKGAVAKDDVLPIAAPGSLKAGDRVLAPVDEVALWQGDVVRVDGAKVVVVLDGKSGERTVPADRVAHLPPGMCDPKAGCQGSAQTETATGGGAGKAPALAAPAAAPADPEKALRQGLKVGDKVLVRTTEIGSSNHFVWRAGTVAGREGDALRVKVDGEAEAKMAFNGDLKPLRKPKRPIAGGMSVLLETTPGRYVEVMIMDVLEAEKAAVVTFYGSDDPAKNLPLAKLVTAPLRAEDY